MKRIVLLFCLSLMVVRVAVSQEVIEYDGLYYRLTDGEAAVVETQKNHDLNPYSGDIIIPEEIQVDGKAYRVTQIEDQAFYRYNSLVMSISAIFFTKLCKDAIEYSEARDVRIRNSSIFSFSLSCSTRLSATLLSPRSVMMIASIAFTRVVVTNVKSCLRFQKGMLMSMQIAFTGTRSVSQSLMQKLRYPQ